MPGRKLTKKQLAFLFATVYAKKGGKGQRRRKGLADPDAWKTSWEEYAARKKVDLSDRSDEGRRKEREAKIAWELSVAGAMSRGEIPLEYSAWNSSWTFKSWSAESHRYREFGYETSSNGFWEPLNEGSTLYHVTTAASSVEKEGLKSRRDRGAEKGVGLGGGSGYGISFTGSAECAATAQKAIKEAASVMRGDVSFAELRKAAEQGKGADEPWDKRWITWIANEGLTLDKIQKGIVREYESGKGIVERKGTPSEVASFKVRAFSRWLQYRYEAGGPFDPYIVDIDGRALAKVRDSDIAVLEYTPKPGTFARHTAKGVGALDEWVVYDMSTLESKGRSRTVSERQPRFPQMRHKYSNPWKVD